MPEIKTLRFAMELRWNPVLGEWVIVAAHRQFRPWQPKTGCPFCPTGDEIGKWEVRVVKNKYPALVEEPPPPFSSPKPPYEVREARGICEVVVETQSHEGDLCDLSAENMRKVIDVFAERYRDLGSKDFVKYVFIFRNKGTVIGVSLHHPHSQIYALPFIPPKIGREMENARKYYEKHRRCLFCDIISAEIESGERIVYADREMVAFVPYSAMWPYEVHIYPRRHVQSLLEMKDDERDALARALRVITATYNALFDFSMPYIMVIHQAPTDGGNYEYYHMHVEFYPPYRDKERLKHPAGVEWGAGTFTYDGVPEIRAKELRDACKRALRNLKL
ncbi:MAG: galactose-1-phosphate uridylyltransferase [Candidatus Baldrarchaeia archaeon]